MNTACWRVTQCLTTIECLTKYIEEASEHLLANWYGNRASGVSHFHPTSETLCVLKRNRADAVEADMRRNLKREVFCAFALYLKCVLKRRNSILEVDVNDRSDNLCDGAFHNF